MFFDGWNPSRVPQKYDRAEYIRRFAREVRVHDSDVVKAAGIVTATARRHMSAGWWRKRSGCSPPICGNCSSHPRPDRPLAGGADLNARSRDPRQPWQPCHTAL